MKNKTFLRFIIFLCFSLSLSAASLKAEISIAPDFQGTIVITSPSGDIHIVSTGEEIPAIVPDSTIELTEGKMTIRTNDQDTAVLVCRKCKMNLPVKSSLHIEASKDGVEVSEVSGNISVADVSGEEKKLKEGTQKYRLQCGEGELAKPTAAGDETGTPAENNDVPVDSRSLESSPSQ